ncbi:antibiotic biosynthesis monooxygenase [Geobacter sulfurreducens]|jgi:quinol monooxygenase YgiN|uniref:Antibiotic biosynthesis monooxygenase domain protein n=1 Tax=Geobacter sulfurreducens (strain ATCC 51573 / DSM 12127 / PCA) TaxID=243231 RepID=Q74GI9_GEOSL|nr:putative quinol monooxygenase [Geobacter sulfurreducens]AAR33591.1 antibiotic biosynthesis monooxygenase domain protein [Geobacter sulfurreducens PCA]ADI83092.1 antibiotic biosynthesis monooxygenase domain protein [Geobacter sulfurreducens KN400]QVW35527.1 antibiotic biosynthesis monooxygenase [Geobacter sulfurreducens]UAC04350.1 antibiotic biosynthesis monooxygenase [Geobacter sulfurreducens]UTG92966.1 antibiotic biosynthesis monooxygenase [Geobacter sulfurreducens]
MPTVTVIAEVRAREEAVDAVRVELLKLVSETRQEEGCLEYRLHQDGDDPALFIFYENWQSPACLERHLGSGHFRAYLAAVEGMIAGKTVRRLSELT